MAHSTSAILGPGPVLWQSAVAVAALMLAVWVLACALHDVSVIDVAWGPAFSVVALVAALTGGGDPARRWLAVGLTAAWGGRLAVHLVRRKRAHPGEDRRYRAMRARHPRRFELRSLATVFAPQATLVLLVSLPLQVGARRAAALGPAAGAGLALFALGFSFESIADLQLNRFSAQPDNAGRVMDRGLWRYTRHPNYFGDACVWWGLWLVAAAGGGGWWTAVGPAAMTLLLVSGSGKRLLERDIAQRRPAYAEYVRSTSGFVPLPPRGRRR